ncbi:hypothetical protein [Pelobacter propionicus]|uniref:Uncharacterized protein n=1 Tax=Pelobacter propionicus (strain DSM 2379 / NBRC 103807 / OttBd1) TaxID=338966 RepID=A1AQS5_PELPD|nr:hypothetical protein [Pelobacter propionicus]ABK99695.1 hypothetical protein Ppro_2087 [Pelobacter propionicus DSM 2379]
MVVRFLVMAGMVVTMLAVGMAFVAVVMARLPAMDMGMLVAVVMARLPAMDMGMLVAVVVGMDMVMLVGMNVHQVPMAVGMLVGMVVRMLMIVGMTMLSFHGALLFRL